jgi:dienelactone hydrolase
MREVLLPIDRRRLPALVHRTREARGIVIVLHDVGVDRRDPRARRLARRLRAAGYATVQPELLDRREARERHDAIDVDLHCSRLVQVVDWVCRQPWAAGLRVGIVAGDIGASVALMAAARRPAQVRALVCRDGRPDCSPGCIPRVGAPTLFLVDRDGWPYRRVYDALPAEKAMVRMESFDARRVAEKASDWLARHLPYGSTSTGRTPASRPRSISSSSSARRSTARSPRRLPRGGMRSEGA